MVGTGTLADHRHALVLCEIDWRGDPEDGDHLLEDGAGAVGHRPQGRVWDRGVRQLQQLGPAELVRFRELGARHHHLDDRSGPTAHLGIYRGEDVGNGDGSDALR